MKNQQLNVEVRYFGLYFGMVVLAEVLAVLWFLDKYDGFYSDFWAVLSSWWTDHFKIWLLFFIPLCAARLGLLLARHLRPRLPIYWYLFVSRPRSLLSQMQDHSLNQRAGRALCSTPLAPPPGDWKSSN